MRANALRWTKLRAPNRSDQSNNGINISGGSGINIGGGSAFGHKTKVVNYRLDQHFASALNDLAHEAKSSAPEAASILEWIARHAGATVEPSKAERKVSKLHDVGGWVWDRFKVIVDSAGKASGPWLFDLIHRLVN